MTRAQGFGRVGMVFLLAACACRLSSPSELTSPDMRFGARTVGNRPAVHYEVFERATNRVRFTTHAEFTTPNDVKAGEFSTSSRLFAAYYHYSHDGPHTWVGVWSTETGNFAYAKTLTGYVTHDPSIFDSSGQ